jgi:alkylhydroperoxidase family enzyme
MVHDSHMRIAPIEPQSAEPHIRKVLEAQAARWGAPLLNHRVYARHPAIFRGARGMWSAIDQCSRIEPSLISLVNRRVAMINGCEF